MLKKSKENPVPVGLWVLLLFISNTATKISGCRGSDLKSDLESTLVQYPYITIRKPQKEKVFWQKWERKENSNGRNCNQKWKRKKKLNTTKHTILLGKCIVKKKKNLKEKTKTVEKCLVKIISDSAAFWSTKKRDHLAKDKAEAERDIVWHTIVY